MNEQIFNKFGRNDFKIIRNNDGYINITELCIFFKKDLMIGIGLKERSVF